MTRRYKKSEIKLTREWAKDLVEEFIDCHLLNSYELELNMIKEQFDIQITKLLIEKSKCNTENKI